MSQLEFEGNGKIEEYQVKPICDSAVYAKESEYDHLPNLYYLVSWKGYPEKENTWEPTSGIQYLWRLLSIFHKEHLEKATATSSLIDLAVYNQVYSQTQSPK